MKPGRNVYAVRFIARSVAIALVALVAVPLLYWGSQVLHDSSLASMRAKYGAIDLLGGITGQSDLGRGTVTATVVARAPLPTWVSGTPGVYGVVLPTATRTLVPRNYDLLAGVGASAHVTAVVSATETVSAGP